MEWRYSPRPLNIKNHSHPHPHWYAVVTWEIWGIMGERKRWKERDWGIGRGEKETEREKERFRGGSAPLRQTRVYSAALANMDLGKFWKQ